MSKSIEYSSKKKISTIFSDFDGTFAEFGKIPDDNLEIIKDFLKLNKENKFIINSGRPRSSLHKIILNSNLLKEYKNHQIGLISSGGVSASFDGVMLWYNPLSFGKSHLIVENIIENNSQGVISSIDGTYSFLDDKKTSTYESFFKIEILKKPFLDRRIESGEFLKSSIKSFENLIDKYTNAYSFFPKEENLGKEEWIFFVPKGIDKGSSIIKYEKLLGLNSKESLIIGDNWNDESMLSLENRTTIVMGNAPRKLLNSSQINYFTKTFKENGFSYALKKILNDF